MGVNRGPCEALNDVFPGVVEGDGVADIAGEDADDFGAVEQGFVDAENDLSKVTLTLGWVVLGEVVRDREYGDGEASLCEGSLGGISLGFDLLGREEVDAVRIGIVIEEVEKLDPLPAGTLCFFDERRDVESALPPSVEVAPHTHANMHGVSLRGLRCCGVAVFG